MTFSPFFQFTGVVTLYLSESWRAVRKYGIQGQRLAKVERTYSQERYDGWVNVLDYVVRARVNGPTEESRQSYDQLQPGRKS